MIFDCPTCTAALRFNPTLNKLECLSCGNLYDVNEFETQTPTDSVETFTTDDSSETMEYTIYSCTACGADLAVNGVESATFCAYCGQPTIVFNRVSSALKPRYIIPFSILKSQAVDAIRDHMSKGFFVPDEIKHFEVERVRGIYIPFWLYDIHYYDKQFLRGKVGSGKHSVTKYFYREAECTFRNLTLDASKQLNNETSQRLEPYDMSSITAFEPGYLSGFYADCYDDTKERITPLAVARVRDMFDKEVAKTVNARNVSINSSEPKHEILKAEYAMFPAWFLTFRYQNEPYTIAVNGQTGKVIGAVPYEKKKVITLFPILGIIFSFFATMISYFLINTSDVSDIFDIVIALLVFAGIMFVAGVGRFHKIRKSIQLTKSSVINYYVKDRQEGI